MKFFKSLSWLIALNLMVKPVWLLLIDRQVQVIVGYESYGSYFSAFNFSVVLYFFADAGLSNMVNQRLAKKINIDTWQLFRIKLVLLVLYAAVSFILGWFIGLDINVLAYIIFIQAFTSLFIFFRSLITARQFFQADAFFSVLDKSLMILLCSGFIYGLFQTVSIKIFLQIQLVSTIIAVLVSIIFSWRNKLLTSGEKHSISQLFISVLPFALIILLMSVHYRLDGFLLERIHADGAFEAGVYASAYRLLDASNMVGYLTASFLVPFIVKNQKQSDVVKPLVQRVQHLLIFLSIIAVCFVFVFGSWVHRLLYHNSLEYNTLVLQLCLASLPAYYFVHVYGSVLTATSELKTFIGILTISVVLNIVLNLILIPEYGALGCCMAALVSQYACAFALIVAVKARFNISVSLSSILLYVASAILLLLFFFLLHWLNVWPWLVVLIAFMLIVAVIVAQFRYFRKNFFINA